ncbi:MAG: hypothetical protein LBI72_00225 [Flavobacteriaceae bacterium]|jgi:hypothetical protein|nr:hypothetical protein [Flavobacteriaceae bacterium]
MELFTVNELDIVFKLNKRNILILILILSLFMILSTLFVFYPSVFVSKMFRSVVYIRIMGGMGCVVFLCLLIGYIRLFFEENGLIISSKGITNKTNLVDVGEIKWVDIKYIEIRNLNKNVTFLIFTKDDSKFFQKQHTFFKKINAIAYRWAYRTSFIIETTKLNCSLEELEGLLRKKTKIKYSDRSV